MSEHYQHVKEVFKHLYKASLYAKVEKYEFHSKLVEYILSLSGLIISNDKVKIIQDWTKAKESKEYSILLRFC